MSATGRAWVFGDNVDTDALAPGLYMKGSLAALASHCLEAVDPNFARSVKPGDIVVGGLNFGIGSSREQAAQVLKELALHAVVARSFGGIFYRNALNCGLLAVTCAETGRISPGDELRVDAAAGMIVNESTGETFACDPVPEHLMEMIEAGGLVPHLAKRLARDNNEQERKAP
jgi:3-isopropylmalate/(R)-2-methylmalate dehydratase small subunit